MKNKILLKTLSVILAVVMVLCSAPLSGFTGIELPDLFSVKAEAYTEGVFTYSVSSGKATITDCDPSVSGDLVIPSTLGGYPVTSIDYYAFDDCDSLTSVTIPDSVTSIDVWAFSDCYSLTSVTIPNSVISIGDYAFYDCDSLTSVTIPDSVTSIGDYAFYSCYSLATVTIPDSVISIGDSAFGYCPSLTLITVDSNNQYYSSDKHGVLYNKDKTTLIQYPTGNSRETFEIPDSVTSIGSDAFDSCDSLTSVTIRNSVTSIGNYAFRYCDSLTSVTIPDSVTSIGDYAFYDCDSLTSVTIGNSVTSIGEHAFYFCDSLTSVTIPDSVTSIGEHAFYFCDSLTSVTIPDSVTSIGKSAFYCHNLTDVYYTGDVESWFGIEFGNSLANPKYYADNIYFNGEVVEDIIIPEDTTAIKKNIFCNFDSVKTVTIPASVITIHEDAFYNCMKIEKVIFEGTESQWEEIVIYNGNYYLINAERTYLDGSHEHSYISSVTTNPTCTEEGVKTFTCGCGDSYTESIPANGHTWSKWMVAVEPTETDNGFKARFCTICDDAIESEVLPATGTGDGEKTGITITLTDENGNVIIKEIVSDCDTDISFENGVYTLTISKENYVARTYTVTAADNMMSLDFSLNKTGDMNGDGKVNAIDVARANAHAKGASALSGYDLACVDVNGDGKVNAIDVALINAHAKGVKSLW